MKGNDSPDIRVGYRLQVIIDASSSVQLDDQSPYASEKQRIQTPVKLSALKRQAAW
jgi:hypothetical protein